MKKKIIAILATISLILTIFLSSILLVTFDKQNYPGHTNNVLEYLNGNENLNPDMFSEREITHMEDVKFLCNLVKILFYISLFFSIGLLVILIKIKDYSLISKIFLYSSLISLGLLILLYLLSLNFNSFFTNFHYLLFTNDLWLLPENSMLIKSFPKEFFNVALKRIFLFITVISSAILINGLILRFRRKDVHS
ncbi:MAG: DUF1461 domain-containing protein [Nanoarchaeota archaeon]|nr:DUF1461 domain-containing protein [Nanoarchaeota archaeon]MBU4352610.1 DUF1461 domain-containing protein [Nanoarchaeota archaeon]